MNSRILCIHHRLSAYKGHLYNEAAGLKEEFEKRNREFLLFISRFASKEIESSLGAFAVFEDPTFQLELSFEERTARFITLLNSHITPVVGSEDLILITVSTQLEARALVRWRDALPKHLDPQLFILFVSDRWNRSGQAEYERQIAEFKILRGDLQGLSPDVLHRIIFCSLTQNLSDELQELLGVPFLVGPTPLPLGGSIDELNFRSSDSTIRVGILGGTRREKGSYLLPRIMDACQFNSSLQFLIQLTNDSLTAEEFQEVSRVELSQNTEVIKSPMLQEEYRAALQSCDVGLFAYESIPYTKRSSGVFIEAAALGKPAVTVRGTWMAEQILQGRAAGTISESLDANSIAEAISQCASNYPELKRLAVSLSSTWIEHCGVSAFVDFIDTAIAKRNAEAPKYSKLFAALLSLIGGVAQKWSSAQK